MPVGCIEMIRLTGFFVVTNNKRIYKNRIELLSKYVFNIPNENNPNYAHKAS